MTELPEPLRLANWLEQSAGASSVYRDRAAAELRRMHRELQKLAQQQMQPCAGRNCGSTNPNLHSAECFEDYEKATGMAQPEQEPVKYRLAETDIYDFAGWLTTRKGVMQIGSSSEAGPMAEAVGEYLKTFPERFAPQRTWAGLTDEDTKLLWAEHGYKSAMCKPFARAIEAKLKEKNT